MCPVGLAWVNKKAAFNASHRELPNGGEGLRELFSFPLGPTGSGRFLHYKLEDNTSQFTNF
jgi:hypothetical protein